MQTRVADTSAAAPTTRTAATAVPEGGPAVPPRISWGAVFAGGIVAVTIGAMLNILGIAIGVSTVDAAAPGETPSASTFGIAGGAWLLVANLIGLAVGGYVAARLSGNSDDTDGVLHGLAVWAIGFLISAVLLGNVVAGTTRTAFQGVSSMVGGMASGAGQAVSAVAERTGVDPQALVERAQNALRGQGGDPAAMTSEQRNAEIARLLTQRVTAGSLAQPERERLTQLVAAEYNIPPQEAQTRLQQVEQQATQAAQQAEQRAREAADAAATGAAVASYWIFAAMLLGAVAAVLGARLGTRNAVLVAQRRYA